MPNWKLIRRMLVPMPVARLYYFWKYRARISGKAEVDLALSTSWGEGCVISPYAKVKIPGEFVMGRAVRIGPGCFIDSGTAGLTIGDDVVIGSNCTIVNVSYRFDELHVPLAEQGLVSSGIRIGHRVHIGPNAVILNGAEIGDDAVVCANSVVSGRVPPHAIVSGSRSRVIPSTESSPPR
jgi:acetyltransferase-like isoleucine patch superfamily enzyme